MNNNNNNNNERIESWLLAVINDGSWERYNDLHIDEINNVYKNNIYWFEGAINSYKLAKKIIEERNLPFIVEVSFSLKSKKKLGNYKIENVKQLKKNLDYTPPSLYVFHKDWPDLKEIINKGELVESLMHEVENFKFYYYQVFDNEDKEIRRVLYVI